MTKSLLALAGLVGMIVLTLPGSLKAAELAAPAVSRAPAYCGPCGCLRVAYNYHPELRSTYGLGFDPRNYDTTEPHYYLGQLRAYPQYYFDGVPVPSSCWHLWPF